MKNREFAKKSNEFKYEQRLPIQEMDVLYTIHEKSFTTQRMLADDSGYSLGTVNESLKNLFQAGYIDENSKLTQKARKLFAEHAPRSAIILAAGFGMRMVPINLSTPKAFLKVNGECLIERLIRQLHEVGITDITVAVGFMKESFEYLIDDYGVDLVVNEDYASRNNMSTLVLASEKLTNAYIVPCDLWCRENLFRKNELYSWYMVTDSMDSESGIRVNRKKELVNAKDREAGNKMIGIAYLLQPESEYVRARMQEMTKDRFNDDLFWEAALYDKKKMIVPARVVEDEAVREINTYEQLRDLDANSDHLKNDAITTIARSLKCQESDIKSIVVLKKGMTNRSFLFSVRDEKYIMRIPGEGTDQLINRRQEGDVYATISGLGLCDDPVYLNPENGYKVTKYLDGVRTCDPDSIPDLEKCMKKLREFHSMNLQVDHTFDIFGQIEFYETLWDGNDSIFRDYKKTKANVISLKDYIETNRETWCLTHIDAVPDNFLFYMPEGKTEEQLQLTDWEYAGMQDPHVDIAMFCIYSLYNKAQCDRLIDIYFENECDERTRTKIYCYIAACGLLWSNWCEYKRKLGVEFGEYSLRQYRFAKDFYKYAAERIEKNAVSEV